MRIIGLDPGLVSGICSFQVADEAVTLVEHHQLDHLNTVAWFEGFRDLMKNRRSEDADTVVAVESFIITPGTAKKSQAPWSLETIGGVRYFVETAGLSLRMSAPSAHKKLVSDDVLKRAGLWFPGEGHACDASRVALHVAIIDHGMMKWTLKD